MTKKGNYGENFLDKDDIFKKAGTDEKKIGAFHDLLKEVFGTDGFVLEANKVAGIRLLNSGDPFKILLALKRIVFQDIALKKLDYPDDVDREIEGMQNELTARLAQKALEDSLEDKINERMLEKQDEYYREVKMQLLNEGKKRENNVTLAKLAKIKKMASTGLASTAMEKLRPNSLKKIVGQEKAINALMAKLACPFPQHIILYGPPGIGKTSAARLALKEAIRMQKTSFAKNAPFIEVDGNTLRWDSRESTNPLIGSVHDPIYQGARRDLADYGVPEPKLGLVSDAHGGILFIDEIGEMDPVLLNKLLKVLEDKKVGFESSYFDSSDENIPEYIRYLFEEGAPADFVLIGATTRDPEEINPAIRSRCGEVFFKPLLQNDIAKIIQQSAKTLKIKLERGTAALIAHYTIEARKANNILADAYGMALYESYLDPSEEKQMTIKKDHVYEVVNASRIPPRDYEKASDQKNIGKIFGLGVHGFIGSILEIEALSFAALQPQKGTIRFNETAGSMAKDSTFNASSVFRDLTKKPLSDYDVHINVIGGGNIDGPSAGLAIFMVIYSSIMKKPIPQNIAITGEISIQGEVKPVGGIGEKVYGALQAGIKKIIIPQANLKDVPNDIKDLEVLPVEQVQEAIGLILEG